jgi:hypothetical protein
VLHFADDYRPYLSISAHELQIDQWQFMEAGFATLRVRADRRVKLWAWLCF